MAEPKLYTQSIEELSSQKGIAEEIPAGPSLLRNPSDIQPLAEKSTLTADDKDTVTNAKEIDLAPLRTDSESVVSEDSDAKENNKVKTRIPVSRFKNTVDRVRKEIETNETPATKIPTPKARSNIPVASAREIKNTEPNIAAVKAEDEFEKLFDEITENGERINSIDSDLLRVTSPMDLDKVDNCFEELIHKYEDDKHEKETITPIHNEDEFTELKNEPRVIDAESLDLNDKLSLDKEENLLDIISNGIDSEVASEKIDEPIVDHISLQHLTIESVTSPLLASEIVEDGHEAIQYNEVIPAIDESVFNEIYGPKSIELDEPIAPLAVPKIAAPEADEVRTENVKKADSVSNPRIRIDKGNLLDPKRSFSQRIAMFEKPKEIKKQTRIPRLFNTTTNRVIKTYPTSDEIENDYRPTKTDSENRLASKPIIVNETPKVKATFEEDKQRGAKETKGEEEKQHGVKETKGEDEKQHGVKETKGEDEKQHGVKETKHEEEKPKIETVSLVMEEVKVLYHNESQNVEDCAENSTLHVSEIVDAKPEVFNVIEKSYANEERPFKLEYQRQKSTDEMGAQKRDRLRKFKSFPSVENQATPQRKKSLAELDLGDTVKGRVEVMVQRMISIEKNTKDIKKVNKTKDLPKAQTVSERIALFEKKAQIDRPEPEIPKTTPKPKVKHPELDDEALERSLEMYRIKIEKLRNASIHYGTSVADMPTIELNDGVEMPVLALATVMVDPVLLPYIVETAIDLGYRALDTAYIYGNEHVVGDAINAKIADGTVKREELFIINKLWSTFHRPDLVEIACRKSLDALGLDYIDLYLIHNPVSLKEGRQVMPKIANVLQFSTHEYTDAWRGMEAVLAKGLVRSIGLCNFNSEQVAKIVEKGKVKPSINQVECHPYMNQHRLEDFCLARDVKLSCYGIMGAKGTSEDLWSSGGPILDNPVVKILAVAAGMTPAQMLIRYQLEHGRAVVVKATDPDHLWENLEALDFKLQPKEIEALNTLNRNKRYYTLVGMGESHKNYPFNIPY